MLPVQQVASPSWIGLNVLMLVVFVWSYWPVFLGLVNDWNRIADYSHGYLVLPLAAFFLWQTWDSFPGVVPRVSWMGVTLIVFAGVMRMVGAWYYLEAFQGWSIPFWIGGYVWMFYGWNAFKWALPAVAFLIFMVPIPFVLENMLAQPLQRISTEISLFILQCLGQGAVAEGTTIALGEHRLDVERACSGLRIFFGIAALAYAFMVLFKRPLWTRLMLVLAILPIALLANSFRIVLTGLLYEMGLDEAAKRMGHDLAGLVMIPLAAGMFGLTIYYLDRLFPEIRRIDVQSLVRSQAERQAST